MAGGVLSGIGFRHIALAGAGIFLLALAVLFFCLPADGHTTTTRRRVPWWTPLRQPRFVAFILAYSSWLLSYNQLYLALPVEIQRSGGREQDLAPLFMLASLLIITLQLPLARFARRMGAVRILPVGFLLLSASFASVALFAAAPPAEGWLRLMPAAGFVTLLTLGQMLLVPAAKDLIPLFAEESTLGAHYGALATAGGCAVLAGNLLLGHLLDRCAHSVAAGGLSPGFCWRCFRCAAPSPCGRSVARWRQHDAERVTARSGSEPTIKYTASGEDNGRAPPYFAASSRRIISAPALRACSLPVATWRGSGAIPQLVDG